MGDFFEGLTEGAKALGDAANVSNEVDEAKDALSEAAQSPNTESITNAASEAIEAGLSVAEHNQNTHIRSHVINQLPESMQDMATQMADILDKSGISDVVSDIAKELNQVIIGGGATINDVNTDAEREMANQVDASDKSDLGQSR